MRAQIRRHAYATTVILLGIATIVGGIGWWYPDSREWLDSHAGTGWLVVVALVVVAVETWMVGDRDVAELERVRDHLKAELARERDSHADALRARDLEIADLTARLHPSARDVAQFKQIEEWLPWERGTLTWLDAAFTGDRWTDKQCDPLYRLEGYWREWFFDDATADEAFKRLRTAIDNLTGWMAWNGSPEHDRDEIDHPSVVRVRMEDREEDRPWRYTIAQAHEREGGYPEYDAARNEAQGLARRVIEERRQFEIVARSRGL